MCRAAHKQLPPVAPGLLDLQERIRLLEERVTTLEHRQAKVAKRVKRKRGVTHQ